MVPLRLIRRTEIQRVRREEPTKTAHQSRSVRGGSRETRDADSGEKNERRTRTEIYSLIETVMAFVRSTCQGHVKTALAEEEEVGGGRVERGQLEPGSP